jgi:dienelactone hydrolase
MALAFVAALGSTALVSLLAARRRGFLAGWRLGCAGVGGAFLLLLLRVLVVYWPQGLEMTFTIGAIAPGFGAVVDLGRMQALGLAGLGVPVFAWLGARGGPHALLAAALLVFAPAAGAGSVYSAVPDPVDPKARWAIFLHGRIVELQGRQGVHPEFGPYAFDAIVGALAGRGLEVVAQVRPASTTHEYSGRVAGQVRKLKAAGVPSGHITVIGFSKGGALARRASAELGDASVGFVILAGCPKKEEGLEPWVPKMAGRMLSLYDASDEMVGSCTPAFRKAPAVEGSETVLRVGKRHGTFFEPQPEWLDPVAAFANR